MSLVPHILPNNLIGDEQHKQFISIQASYGIAQRGGTQRAFLSERHNLRLVHDANILDSIEQRSLIFREAIFSN